MKLKSFHVDMKGVIKFGSSYSVVFNICSGMKQNCVLASTLFGIFFAVMLKLMFGASTETDDVYLHTRTDKKLFSLSQLRAKSKVREVFIRDVCR